MFAKRWWGGGGGAMLALSMFRLIESHKSALIDSIYFIFSASSRLLTVARGEPNESTRNSLIKIFVVCHVVGILATIVVVIAILSTVHSAGVDGGDYQVAPVESQTFSFFDF